ncbi:unnamed protein product [Coccothraustes coccothraustes]
MGQATSCFGSRKVFSSDEVVLNTAEALICSPKASKSYLPLLQEELVVTKLRVFKKLPAANLLLLEQLLALLWHSGQHVSTRHRTCSNLAIWLGANLLSPMQEDQLELEAVLAKNDEVSQQLAAALLAKPTWLPRCVCAIIGGCLSPAKAEARAACNSCHPATFLCTEKLLSSDGKGCLAFSQAP